MNITTDLARHKSITYNYNKASLLIAVEAVTSVLSVTHKQF